MDVILLLICFALLLLIICVFGALFALVRFYLFVWLVGLDWYFRFGFWF